MIAAVVVIQLVEFTSGTGVEHCKAIFTCGKEDTMDGIFVRIVCTGMLLPVQCAESVISQLDFFACSCPYPCHIDSNSTTFSAKWQ